MNLAMPCSTAGSRRIVLPDEPHGVADAGRGRNMAAFLPRPSGFGRRLYAAVG
jgi:hypothetical protein